MPQTACQNTQRISQQTLLAALGPEHSVTIMLQRIPLSSWGVKSFDPAKNDACVVIDNGKRVVILNVLVPDVIVK